MFSERPTAPSVPLLAAGGRRLTLESARGKWVWLYFGFANCPGACPFALDFMAAEYRRLKRPEDVQVVFVSVDPARDTPDVLGPYTRHFHPDFLGVTGARGDLDTLTAGLGASYKLYPPETPGGSYMVGHPNVVYVLDPQGRLAATYEPTYDGAGPLSRDFNQGTIASDGASAPAGAVLPDSTGAAWCGILPGDLPRSEAQVYEALMQRARTLGSGTSVVPADSPMRMWAWPAAGWLWMAHGDAVAGLNVQGGPRGALISPTWAAENWAMLMGSRPLGPGLLDLRWMGSLDALTLPPGGTPQLFQDGETYRFAPIIDRQHPHDLLMELAGRYTWNFDARTALFLYGGPAGEPALGPGAFMHRASAADNHWAPLGHHHQDATHVSYGVATIGARRDDFQLEASAFNGREPDENRFDVDWGVLDSYAARLSWFPGRQWALQLSQGWLKDQSPLHPGEVRRTTASVMHVRESALGLWSTALLWGQNQELADATTLQSLGLESQLDVALRHHLYGRLEWVQKTGLPPGPPLNHDLRNVNALTLGYAYDMGPVDRYALALGGDATASMGDATYGALPVSFRVYMRLRPPTMRTLAP